MPLTVAFSDDRSFSLNFVNLVSSDGVKRNVDDQNDGNWEINVNCLNNSILLNPASLYSNQRLEINEVFSVRK
jgi:hypothetical protein